MSSVAFQMIKNRQKRMLRGLQSVQLFSKLLLKLHSSLISYSYSYIQGYSYSYIQGCSYTKYIVAKLVVAMPIGLHLYSNVLNLISYFMCYRGRDIIVC